MKFLYNFIFSIISFAGISQPNSYDRFWYFAPNTGFDFSSGIPVLVVASAADNIEGSNTTNDKNGNLLFYGGDDVIYNRNHVTMMNGTGLDCSTTPKQGPVSVKVPGSATRYYYIYPSGAGGALKYSIVDMSLAATFGAVDPTAKNILIRNNCIEGIYVIRKANKCNEYWLITHDINNSTFFVDEITSSGITLGTAQNIGPTSYSMGGYMAYAPATGKLAMLHGTFGVALFDFNSLTGVISNHVAVPLPAIPFTYEYYSCEFSPDGTKLYVGGGYGQNHLVQVDIANANQVTGIATGNGGNTLKLGPDGKIYGGQLYTTFIGVINNPNGAGIACNYTPNTINMGNVVTDAGFPSMVLVDDEPVVALSNPVTICKGQSTLVTASGGTTYLWSNGSTGNSVTISPTVSSVYTVTVSNGICADTSSILVTVNSIAAITFPGNISLCVGDTTTITASGGVSYLWNTGYTNTSITVAPTISSIYSVTVSDGTCFDTASVLVTAHQTPAAFAGNDTSICPGNPLLLVATGGSNYFWNTGNSTASISVLPVSSGIYSVTVSDGNCSDVDSLNVTLHVPPIAVARGSTTIQYGNSVVLTASGAGTYYWYPSAGLTCNTCSNPVASPSVTTVYYLLVTDINGCTSLDSVVIIVDLECGDIFVPNAFSPNNDGQNDICFVKGKCVKNITFKIYNRWGELVFETNDITIGWTGFYNNKLMDTGVFYYTLDVMLITSQVISKKGNISLIR